MRDAGAGRYFVLLSLAEAETVRAIMHQRQGRALVDGGDVALALRCLPAGDAIFDASPTAAAAEPPISISIAAPYSTPMHASAQIVMKSASSSFDVKGGKIPFRQT